MKTKNVVTIELHVDCNDKKTVAKACKAVVELCRDMRDDGKRNKSDFFCRVLPCAESVGGEVR